MTIYYTVTFFILVIEMVIFGVLVLPLPSHWRRAMLEFTASSPSIAKAVYVLKIVFAFIFILFVDTINRLQRIGTEKEEEGRHYDHNYEANMKARKFYAQRNLYLTGFTLFLSLILERTSALVIEMLKREEELRNVKNEATSTTKGQQQLIDAEADYKKKIDGLEKELKGLNPLKRDYENLKKQVAQQSVEYDRLADERDKLARSSGQKIEQKKDI